MNIQNMNLFEYYHIQDFVDEQALCKAFQFGLGKNLVKGVANLRCSLIFEICLFFNEIDAEVLDGTRLSRVPRVRGVNLHVFKAGGNVVHCSEHLLIVDEDLDLGVSVFCLLDHLDLGPLVNRGGREAYFLVLLFVE